MSKQPGTDDYVKMLAAIQADERYQQNLDWGKPRHGHPEGTVRAHIADLERNLNRLRHKLTEIEVAQLRLLIHTHDTFKPDATPGVRINDPRSHASLAQQFLAEYCDDEQLLTIIQYHDEPYALWLQFANKAACDHERFRNLMDRIADWDLFLAFLVIDGCNPGKDRSPLFWMFQEVSGKVESRFTAGDIL
ncbi:MAG: hypothetical protein K8T25_21340 [Planctomycetia bacterium]|nr:hypothetical protein [Planctomycetia bacterium]